MYSNTFPKVLSFVLLLAIIAVSSTLKNQLYAQKAITYKQTQDVEYTRSINNYEKFDSLAHTRKFSNGKILHYGIGVSFFNEDVKQASNNTGVNMSLSLFNFHFDFAANMVTGKGTELDFQSNQTTKSDKKSIAVFNFGYSIDVKKFSFIPVLGYAYTEDIYEDPIAFDTFYYANHQGEINFGGRIGVDLYKGAGIMVGVGTIEKLNFSVRMGF